MSAPFVALALSYCLGRGRIRLLGSRKRPWLEITRRETDLTYLLHQSRQLHKLHDGPLDLVIDTVQTDGFYDDRRLCCHGEGLYRVYELLYPRDTYTISDDLLDIAGHRGIVSLWCDKGRIRNNRYEIPFGTRARNYADTRMVRRWLRRLGYAPDQFNQIGRDRCIRFSGCNADDFARRLRPQLPRHRVASLRR